MRIVTNSTSLSAYKVYLRLEKATNTYLSDKGYLKLDLPVLSPVLVPESYLEVFETDFGYMERKEKLYLTPSPELFIKRVLAHMKIDCYSLGKSFRNGEPDSSKHSPEFTMLEFYKLGVDYMGIADEVLGLLNSLSGGNKITYQGKDYSFGSWEKLTVEESFIKYAHIQKNELFSEDALKKHAVKRGYSVEGFTYEDIFSQIYAQEVEPHLGMNGKATMLYDYPKEFAALAKLNSDGKTAQRFEFYIGGIELGDCYTELTDPNEQKTRFEQEDKKRGLQGNTQHPVDWGFIDALKHGLPDCSGIAIGFERLAMIFADVTSIHDLRLIDVV
ncbi:hypothetical protein HYS00_05390 [Candidatus Microgenomates bacterium]|nr:hypothetical protein [Candidatus Microgenomates bacterium]